MDVDMERPFSITFHRMHRHGFENLYGTLASYWRYGDSVPWGVRCKCVKEQRTSKRTAYTEYCPFGVRRVSYEMAGVENKDQNTEDKQPISMRDILPKASFLSKAESPKRQGSSALVKTEPPELSDIRQVVSCVSDRSIYPNCETPPPIDRMVYNSPMKVEAEKSVKSEPPENVVYTQCVRPDIGPDGLRLLSSGVPYLKTLNYKDRSYVEGLISSRCSDEKANEENLSSRRFSPNTATKTETVHDSEEKQYVSSCESSRNRDFIYKTEPITSSYVRDAVTVSRLSTLVRPISSVLPPSSYTDNLSRRQYSENEPYTKDAKETAVLPRDIRTRSEHVKSEAYHNGHVSPCDDATNEDSKTRILSPERGSDDDRKSRILSPERSSDDSGHESDKDDTIIIRPREQPQYWHDEGSRTVETKDPNCRLPCCSQMDFKVERESFSPIKIPARRAVPAHIRPELYSREEPFHDSNHSAFSVIRPGQKRPDEEGLESVRQGSAIKVRVIQSNSPPPNRTVQDVAPKNGENGGTITTTSLLESVLSHKADLLRNAELGLTGGITNARYPYHTVHASSDLFTIPPPQPPAVQCSTIDSTENGLLGLTRVANEQLGRAIAKEQTRKPPKTKANDCLHLWEFLRDQLNMEDSAAKCMEWTNKETGEFRLIKTGVVAKRWGESKNRTSMTYEKMARAMRYYYKMNILEKVPHKRLHFRFGKTMLPKVVPSTA